MSKESDLKEVLEKVEKFKGDYLPIARRLHEIIMDTAPELCPRVWYGMPGYAKSPKEPVMIYFRADKYLTFGLTEKAPFDFDGCAPKKLCPTAWFFSELTEAGEGFIRDIVKRVAK